MENYNPMNYKDKLRDPRWQKRRLQILNRDYFTCTHCGDSETELHVHHKKYRGEPWDAPDNYLTTVCKHCHEIVTKVERADKGVIVLFITTAEQLDGSYLHFVGTNATYYLFKRVNSEIHFIGNFGHEIIDFFNGKEG